MDCVVLFPVGKSRNRKAFEELQDGLPFLDIALVGPMDFEEFVTDLFAIDRFSNPKGMIEVAL